jgi:hypothetical protein
MPAYKYQCVCGCRFTKTLTPAKRGNQKCPACDALVDSEPPVTVGSVYNHAVASPTPQNTGFHNLDTNIDRVIGDHARQGWETVKRRQFAKRQLLHDNPDKSGFDLIRTQDHTYEFKKS